MPDSQSFIVGRQSEVDHFAALVQGQTAYPLLNIYGPGGIGKTVVGQKMQLFADTSQIPLAFIDGNRQDLTPHRILYEIADGLTVNEKFDDAFANFTRQYRDYDLIQEVMQLGGGLQTMFSVVGMPKDPEALSHILSSLKTPVSQEVEQIVSNRFALERYLRNVERALTGALVDGLATAASTMKQNLAILFDTYEQMEGFDDWICRHLYPLLPDGVKMVILGRNALPRINFDWNELEHNLHAMELPELPEADAKAYLQHYELRDPVALDEIYRFTGGYPLLLVLVVHLAHEAGGWQHVGRLEYEADRDRVATKLLERILREERVQEVQAFLEKGVVARWFTPEIVSEVLAVSSAEGRTIYNKLHRHSFVERHPLGLKFHDKIRDLLLTRLKFTDKAEHDRIAIRLQRYYAAKAGIEVEIEEEAAGSSIEISSPTKDKKNSFGRLLSYYRRQTNEPERGGYLTQKKLADLLGSEEGLIYSHTMISNWERGHTQISLTNRATLIGLIRILYKYKGIKTIEEANKLLFTGGHRPLDSGEEQKIFGE